MPQRLKSSLSWSSLGWIVPLAFVALPNCKFNPPTAGASLTSAVFCDVEDKNQPRRCATQAEVDAQAGLPLADAAIALTTNVSKPIGFDFSLAARQALNCGELPVAIFFKTPFPQGVEVCLDCAGTDAQAACTTKCESVNNDDPNADPTAEVTAFCADAEHAHPSTNASNCFDNACTDAGNPDPAFADPRLKTEAVVWQDVDPPGSLTTSGPDNNTLTRQLATASPPPGAFDAGAASAQTITKGNGYVEFTASELGTARVLGLSSGAPPDGDHSDADINFGIRLAGGGFVLISENGGLVVPPNGDNTTFHFAPFATGDRLRVTVTEDPADPTKANIAYVLIPASCSGPACTGMQLRPTPSDPPLTASYPFRVDATIREQGGTLTDARIVRIK